MTEEKTAKVVENTEKNGSDCLKSRGELARELFREGYNCSQAVTLAFADELETRGISREMAAGLGVLVWRRPRKTSGGMWLCQRNGTGLWGSGRLYRPESGSGEAGSL